MNLLIVFVEVVVLTFVTIYALPLQETNRHPESISESGNQPEPYSLKQYIKNLNISSDDEQLYRIMQGMKKNGDTNHDELNGGFNSQLSEHRNKIVGAYDVKHAVNEQNNENEHEDTLIDTIHSDESKPEQLQNNINDNIDESETAKDNKGDVGTIKSNADEAKIISGKTDESETINTDELEPVKSNTDKQDTITDDTESLKGNTDESETVKGQIHETDTINDNTDESETVKGDAEQIKDSTGDSATIKDNTDEAKPITDNTDKTETINTDEPEPVKGQIYETDSINDNTDESETIKANTGDAEPIKDNTDGAKPIKDNTDETETINTNEPDTVKSSIDKKETTKDETKTLTGFTDEPDTIKGHTVETDTISDNTDESKTEKDNTFDADPIKDNTDEAKSITDKTDETETVNTDKPEPVKSNIDIPDTITDKTDESKTNKGNTDEPETINNKADTNPSDVDISNANGAMIRDTDQKHKKGDNTPDSILVKGTVNPEQILPVNLESNTEKDDIRNDDRIQSDDQSIDNTNVNNKKMTKSNESLTTLKYLDTELVITSAIEKNFHPKGVTRLPDIMLTTSLNHEAEPNKLVTNSGKTDLNNDEEQIDKIPDKKSAVENNIGNNREKVSANNVTDLSNQVISTKAFTVVSTSANYSQNNLNMVTDKTSENNEEMTISTERNILVNVDAVNDQLSGRGHTKTNATKEIVNENNLHEHDQETNMVHSTSAPNSFNSDSTWTDVADVKDTTTPDIKQKMLNDKSLSFHSLEEPSKQQFTKPTQVPVSTEKHIHSIKDVETPSNNEHMPGGYKMGIGDDVDAEVKPTDDKPCRCIGDSEQMYPGSALIACTVGGVFIGVFVVLLLFNARDKCKRYVNGDYRRVPMEYDFELNPRLKTH